MAATDVSPTQFSIKKLFRKYRQALRKSNKKQYKVQRYTSADKYSTGWYARKSAQEGFNWWSDWALELHEEIKRRGYWLP